MNSQGWQDPPRIDGLLMPFTNIFLSAGHNLSNKHKMNDRAMPSISFNNKYNKNTHKRKLYIGVQADLVIFYWVLSEILAW